MVEDETEVLNLTSRLLELEGYRVLRAADGASGFDMVSENFIDLLLLDLQLPVRDGWSVLRQIRSLPWLARLPIVIFTASVAACKREEALNLGARAYLVKPVDMSDLISTVANILSCAKREVGGGHVVTEAMCAGS